MTWMPGRIAFLGFLFPLLFGGNVQVRAQLRSANLPRIQPLKPPISGGLALTEVLVRPTKAWGEYVEILNRNPLEEGPMDLSGYQIRSGNRSAYLFPRGTKLASGELLLVDFSQGKTAMKIPKGCGAKVLIAGYRGSFFASNGPTGDGYLKLLDSKGNFVDGFVWDHSAFPPMLPGPMSEVVEQGLWASGQAVVIGQGGDRTRAWKRKAPFGWLHHVPDDWAFVGVAMNLSPGTPYGWLGNEHEMRIRVVDAKGAPLAGVKVEVPSKKLQGMTDSEGTLTWQGFGGGSWNFHLQKDGFVERWVGYVRKAPYRRGDLEVLLLRVADVPHVQGELGQEGGTLRDASGTIEMRFPKGFLRKKTKIEAYWAPKVYSRWKERRINDGLLGRGPAPNYSVPLGTLVVRPDLLGNGKVQVLIRAALSQYSWEGSKELWRRKTPALLEQIEGDGVALPAGQAGVKHVNNQVLVEFATSRFSSFVLSQEKRMSVGEFMKDLKNNHPDQWRLFDTKDDRKPTKHPDGGKNNGPISVPTLLCGIGSKTEEKISRDFKIQISSSSGWSRGMELSLKAKLGIKFPFLANGETEVGGKGSLGQRGSTSNSKSFSIHFEKSISHTYDTNPCYDRVEIWLLWKEKTFFFANYNSKTRKTKLVRIKLWIPDSLKVEHGATNECCMPNTINAPCCRRPGRKKTK